MQYFDEPVGRAKIQTTNKNSQRCYTLKRLMRGLLSNDFFSQNSDLPSFLTFTRPVGMRRVQIFNNYPAKSRGISSDNLADEAVGRVG